MLLERNSGPISASSGLCGLGFFLRLLANYDQPWPKLADLGSECAVFADIGQSWPTSTSLGRIRSRSGRCCLKPANRWLCLASFGKLLPNFGLDRPMVAEVVLMGKFGHDSPNKCPNLPAVAELWPHRADLAATWGDFGARRVCPGARLWETWRAFSSATPYCGCLPQLALVPGGVAAVGLGWHRRAHFSQLHDRMIPCP